MGDDFVYVRLYDGTGVRLLMETVLSVSVFQLVAKEAIPGGKRLIGALRGLLSTCRWKFGRAWKAMGLGAARRCRSGARQSRSPYSAWEDFPNPLQRSVRPAAATPSAEPVTSPPKGPHLHHCQDDIGSSRPQKDSLSASPVDVMGLPKMTLLQRRYAARRSTLRNCDRISLHQNPLRDTSLTASKDIDTLLIQKKVILTHQ